VKFWLRWLADGIAIFLALYLVDSLLHERFHLEATWAGVAMAFVLSFLNSFIRPLQWGKSKPQRAALVTIINVLVNALIIQLFVWVKVELTTAGFIWVLLTATFVTLLAGVINWLVGFGPKDKPRSTVRERPARTRAR
jgi:uncharacterized membrane protein YvlD (DUF360 family)